MKNILTILFAVILPVSGLQISLDRHYCGGSLADVRISFSGKPATCGMESEEQAFPSFQTVESNCCEDQMTVLRIAGQYFPEQFKLKLPVRNITILYHPETNLGTTNPGFTTLISHTIKSSDDLRQRLKPPDICIFRI
jgi:hypothetical protein